ncbi:MAG: hypothetical protein J6R04_03785 [Clostridia bacterium]|nr:hypothetical protein [Clostridia bacterium]
MYERHTGTSARRIIACVLLLCLLVGIFPPIRIAAADEALDYVFDATPTSGAFYNSPIVLTPQTLAAYTGVTKENYSIKIIGSPFSVTVKDVPSLDIRFEDITIDRSKDASYNATTSTTRINGAAMVQASIDLGWNEANNRYYVPTCPFLITGASNVTASFFSSDYDPQNPLSSTPCLFRAGANGWYVTGTGATTMSNNTNYRGGYAGVQVDGKASLTIEGGIIEAWGAYQFGEATDLDAAIAINRVNTATEEDGSQWPRPNGANAQQNGGGAGIGGGASYNERDGYNNNGHNYVQGTPGNITINGGSVTAIGGYQAAGIGGGTNSAATTGAITVNGGNVLAIGGRWSAGIGDGDSENNIESMCYAEDYAIVINGGTVECHGGCAAAGIGTTDQITSRYGKTSGMTINFHGGDITAVSGYPDAQSTNPSNATAAVGAGENTDMAPYSISIEEGVIVKASSFSHYAISNIGTNAETIPDNSIDPNTYMYLAYYDAHVTSQNTRYFNLYRIMKDELGNFMVVAHVAENVLSAGESDIYFGYEGADLFYLVDSQGKIIDNDGDGRRDYLVFDPASATDPSVPPFTLSDPDGNRLELDVNPMASLKMGDEMSYYFVAPALKTFEVPGEYTAVAMTLYDPALFGGKYILHAPTDHTTPMPGDIYAVIEKPTSGESSGQLIYRDDGHFELSAPIGPSNSGVIEDIMSADLTNIALTSAGIWLLDAYSGNNPTTLFVPGTKSYDIWLPAGATNFTVLAEWTVPQGTGVTVEMRRGNTTLATSYAGQTSMMCSNIPISQGETVVIWVEKTDGTLKSVLYKLTVRVKMRYYLTPDDISKVYDGEPVAHPSLMMLQSSEGSRVYTYGTPVYRNDSGSQSSFTPPSAATGAFSGTSTSSTVNVPYRRNNNLRISYTNAISYNEAAGTVTLTTTLSSTSATSGSREIVVTTVFSQDANGNIVLSTSQTGSLRYRSGMTTYTYEAEVDADENGGTLTIYCTAYTSGVKTVCSFSYDTVTGAGVDTRAAALEAAKQAAIAQMGSGTTGIGEAAYTVSSNVSARLTLDGRQYNWTRSEHVTGTVSVTAQATITGDVSHLLTDDVNIHYHYAQTALPDGTEYHRTYGTERPIDAGHYVVVVTAESDEFEASGTRDFVISQRPITVSAIENWRYYLDSVPTDPYTPIPIVYDEVSENTSAQPTTGVVSFEGLVERDKATPPVLLTAQFAFRDRVVEPMRQDKITVYATLPANTNYTFANYPDAASAGIPMADGSYFFEILGEVAYRIDGAMFAKEALSDTAPWRKYYPVVDLLDDSYLKWNADGTPADDRIDYHSPNNVSHAEHVYFYTVNRGEEEARYAVDIISGDMTFVYTKTIWDVNDLTYEDLTDSYWTGADGVNNVIRVENRSNRPIEYTVGASIGIHDAMSTSRVDLHLNDHVGLNKEQGIVLIMTWNGGMAMTRTGSFITSRMGLGPADAVLGQATHNNLSVELFGIPQSSRTVGRITVTVYAP